MHPQWATAIADGAGIQEHTAMAAAIAEVSGDMDETKRRKWQHTTGKLQRLLINGRRKKDEAIKKEALMPSLKQDVDKGINHMHSLPVK